MNFDSIAPEALKLSLRERVQLAASLWDSIEDPYALAADRTDEDAIALALSRDTELESGQVDAISHSDLMQRLRG
jgi:putative addiction module component (TIGR02574 family)